MRWHKLCWKFNYCIGNFPTNVETQGLLQGASLQTESCGEGTESWSCLLSPSSSLPADHPGVVAEVGAGCRCGCVVHVGVAKPGRILATSTVSCPGRTFWLVQVNVSMQLFAPVTCLPKSYLHSFLNSQSWLDNSKCSCMCYSHVNTTKCRWRTEWRSKEFIEAFFTFKMSYGFDVHA